MELQQLKYFKTVVEKGTIAAAAEALFLSAPALSTSISRLEKELGTPLFDRTGNRIRLNAQGALFLRHINRVFDELEEAREELQQSLRREQNITMATVSSSQWVDLISAFSQEYPGLPISCTSLKYEHLAEGGLPSQFTFLFASEDAVPEEYAVQMHRIPLFEDYPVIAVHDGHPLACRKQVDLKELMGENLFLPMYGYSLHAHLEDLFVQNGLPFPTGNAFPHLAGQQLAMAGKGIAFASAHTARIPAFNLRYIPIHTISKPWTACLYWKKNRKLNRNEQIFKNFVEQYYQKDREALSMKRNLR